MATGTVQETSSDAMREARDTVAAVYRSESRRVLATLIRLLGDFDLAEEALHDAFTAALEQWQREGIPGNPRAWLVSAGRFKAIDKIRRRARFDASVAELAYLLEGDMVEAVDVDGEGLEDDRLRLILFAMRVFPIRCLRGMICRSGSTPCCE
jgi:RNA polymerase sigma-70 factor (ECF subfamily)